MILRDCLACYEEMPAVTDSRVSGLPQPPAPALKEEESDFLGIAGKYVIGTKWSNLKGHLVNYTVGNGLKINLLPSRDKLSYAKREISCSFHAFPVCM